jgi:aspartate kinase
MAILSLVGADMKNMIGIAGRMFSTLGEHNVNIEMISQGKPSSLFASVEHMQLTG